MVALIERQETPLYLEREIMQLLPSREGLLSPKQVLGECKKLGVPLSLRTLQLWVSEDLITKPVRIGREAFFDRNVVFDEIVFLFLTKAKLGWRLHEIARVMENYPTADERKQLLLRIETVVKEYPPKIRKRLKEDGYLGEVNALTNTVDGMVSKAVNLLLKKVLLEGLPINKIRVANIAQGAYMGVRDQLKKQGIDVE